MHRAHRFATPAVLVALVLVLATGSGCGGTIDPNLIPQTELPEHVKVVRLQLPSFDEGELEGIWLWRRSETSGEFEPVSEIRLGAVVFEGEQEFVEYELLDPSGTSLGLTLSAAVDRSGPVPQLALWVLRFAESGAFKASVYNAAGESPLSTQTVRL
jgi:hypothetical protein